MFEKYSIDDLYYGKILACDPIIMENYVGCIGAEYVSSYSYCTILYYDGNRYIDIKDPNRIINFINNSRISDFVINEDDFIYKISPDGLVKLRDCLGNDKKDCKVLKKLPFGRVKFY